LGALRGIGQTLVRLKRYSEAVIELNKAILVYPHVSEFYYGLSQAYIRLDDREKAAQAAARFQQLHAREDAEQNLRAR
jgi:predicted Zn-dependent protease